MTSRSHGSDRQLCPGENVTEPSISKTENVFNVQSKVAMSQLHPPHVDKTNNYNEKNTKTETPLAWVRKGSLVVYYNGRKSVVGKICSKGGFCNSNHEDNRSQKWGLWYIYYIRKIHLNGALRVTRVQKSIAVFKWNMTLTVFNIALHCNMDGYSLYSRKILTVGVQIRLQECWLNIKANYYMREMLIDDHSHVSCPQNIVRTVSLPQHEVSDLFLLKFWFSKSFIDLCRYSISLVDTVSANINIRRPISQFNLKSIK